MFSKMKNNPENIATNVEPIRVLITYIYAAIVWVFLCRLTQIESFQQLSFHSRE